MFRAVDFPRLCRGRKNVVKRFYFTYVTTSLSSTCVQHAKTFAINVSVFYFTCNHLQNNFACFANVLRWLHVK